MKCNRTAMADILNVGVTTVDARVKEGMPFLMRPGVEGSKEWLFDTGAVIEWLTTRGDDVEKRDKDKESKSRDLEASAGLKWLEFGEKQKLMVSVEDVRMEWEESLGICKSGINAFPGRLSQKVAVEADPATCQRLIKEECNALLDQMHRDFERWTTEHPSELEAIDV